MIDLEIFKELGYEVSVKEEEPYVFLLIKENELAGVSNIVLRILLEVLDKSRELTPVWFKPKGKKIQITCLKR